MKRSLAIIAFAGTAFSSHATVYLNQTNWPTAGSRTFQGLPTNSAWFSSSSGSLSVSSSQLRFIVVGSGAAMTYFTPNSNSPPIQLNVGDTMTTTLRFNFNGVPPVGSSSQGFRIGLMNTANASNSPNRATSDGSWSNNGSGTFVEGYALFQKMYGTFSDDEPIDIRKRTTLTSASLLGTSGDWTSLAKGGNTNSFSGFTNLVQQYTFQIVLQRTNLSSLAIGMTWSNLSNGATLSVATSDNVATNFGFDTIQYRPANNTQAPSTNFFQQTRVEVTSVPVAPSILAEPQDVVVASGQNATFSLVVNGTLPLYYEWYYNTNTLAGSSTIDFPPAHTPVAQPTLTLPDAQPDNAGSYFIVVSNTYGSVTSAVASLTVNLVPPSITTQPQDVTVIPGQDATFSVAADGSEPFTYQWYYNTTTPVLGATDSTLILGGVQPGDAGSYSVLVSNPVGSVISSNAILTVNTNPVAPLFITQPASRTVQPGEDVGFSAFAVGTQPISYQWNTNGLPLPGATLTTLNLTNVQTANAGNYTLTASNSIGSTISSVAVLTVKIKVPPPLPNIPTNQFNILNYGAFGNGVSNNAAAIQSAINAASSAGGGIVVVPTNGALNTYFSGPIVLANSINLQINSGAMLKMLPRLATPTVTNWPNPNLPLISASGRHDIAITGSGTINGNAGFGSTNWWRTPTLDESLRPDMINFGSGCSNILVQDVTLQNPPVFHMVLKGNNVNVTIQGITVNTPGNSPNTDGMDIGSTSVLIQNCSISCGDDNIQMGSSAAPVSDITVSNCTFGTGHGVSIGSPTQRGVNDLLVSNCTFNGTSNGIRMKSDRGIGGLVENLKYLDITMTNVGYPIIIYSYYNSIGTPNNISPSTAATATVYAAQSVIDTTPIWRNITISNLTVASTTGANIGGIIWGRQEMVVSNVTLYNVNIAAPSKTFDIYNARGIRVINSNLTAPSSTNTLTLYNAEVTVTNTAPSATLVTLGGLTKPPTNNVLTFFNAQAAIIETNVLGPNPLLTLSRSTLAVSNGLNLGGTSTLNFGLGTSVTRIDVAGNLGLNGTLNVTDAGGLANTSYTLLTYAGALTGPGLSLGAVPTGHNYALNTNTPGQVNLVVTPGLSAFQQWQIDYFSSTNNPAADPNVDADGDGMNNTNEFLSGTNPTNSLSALRIISAVQQSTNVVITWATAGGRTNAVQATGGNAGGYTTNFTDISGPIIISGGGDATTNHVDTAGATNNPARYYRVRLVP